MDLSLCTHLKPRDIKSTRLVCRCFNALSAPLLVKTAYFAARLNTLKKFLNIAKHPVFSRTVRTVIYEGTFYREALTQREAFENEAVAPPGEGSTRSFERYCSMFENQRRLMDSGAALGGLIYGLRKMARVQTIVFTDSWDGDDRYGYYESDRCDGVEPFLSPSGWDSTDRISDFDGLAYILRAASISHSQIQYLEMSCSYFRKVDPKSIPCAVFNLPPQDLQHGLQAFRSLTSITLDIGHRGFESENEDLKGLFHMLSGAEHLHTLTLETKHCALLTPVLVRNRFWPRLKNLTLYFILCEYEFVTTVLWNQRTTLAMFTLSHSYVFGDDPECDEAVLEQYAQEHLNLEGLAVSNCDFFTT
ncbi:MAG: hypothetical protein M1839_007002 [Geoglossum umbratile]|nr:MAG: hypothetical protein M1839_007002 [Geoglossum umbratile]